MKHILGKTIALIRDHLPSMDLITNNVQHRTKHADIRYHTAAIVHKFLCVSAGLHPYSTFLPSNIQTIVLKFFRRQIPEGSFNKFKPSAIF